MTDLEIITSIRQGNREPAIVFLYKEYPKLKNWMLKSGANVNVVNEIFNDSLVIFCQKVVKPDFELNSSAKTFLYGINRFLLKNELKKQNKFVELEWSHVTILSENDIDFDHEKEQQFKILEKVLVQVSEKCQQIFKAFYFQQKSMTEIADLLGFSSVNSAKTQKYKCIEKAFELSKTFKS
jgi:RNA polymerase sigma factor (sigma-70 family)